MKNQGAIPQSHYPALIGYSTSIEMRSYTMLTEAMCDAYQVANRLMTSLCHLLIQITMALIKLLTPQPDLQTALVTEKLLNYRLPHLPN